MSYINKKIFGLPKPTKKITTHKRKTSLPEYVHHVVIKNTPYFKVHIKRSDVSKIKYFKTLTAATMFVDSLRLNPYL